MSAKVATYLFGLQRHPGAQTHAGLPPRWAWLGRRPADQTTARRHFLSRRRTRAIAPNKAPVINAVSGGSGTAVGTMVPDGLREGDEAAKIV